MLKEYDIHTPFVQEQFSKFVLVSLAEVTVHHSQQLWGNKWYSYNQSCTLDLG